MRDKEQAAALRFVIPQTLGDGVLIDDIGVEFVKQALVTYSCK